MFLNGKTNDRRSQTLKNSNFSDIHFFDANKKCKPSFKYSGRKVSFSNSIFHFLKTSSALLKSKKFDYQQFDRYLNIQFFHEIFRQV